MEDIRVAEIMKFIEGPVMEDIGRANKTNAIRDYETSCSESSDILSSLTGLRGQFTKLSNLIMEHFFGQSKRIGEVQRPILKSFRAIESRKISEGLEFRGLNREVRLHEEKRKKFFERLCLGIFGGISLTAPMLLMIFHPGLNTSVITVSVATIIFVLVLASGNGLAGKDVLAATAAYVAVLVVFVGTSMSPVH